MNVPTCHTYIYLSHIDAVKYMDNHGWNEFQAFFFHLYSLGSQVSTALATMTSAKFCVHRTLVFYFWDFCLNNMSPEFGSRPVRRLSRQKHLTERRANPSLHPGTHMIVEEKRMHSAKLFYNLHTYAVTCTHICTHACMHAHTLLLLLLAILSI